jgi:hypothetical protein
MTFIFGLTNQKILQREKILKLISVGVKLCFCALQPRRDSVGYAYSEWTEEDEWEDPECSAPTSSGAAFLLSFSMSGFSLSFHFLKGIF